MSDRKGKRGREEWRGRRKDTEIEIEVEREGGRERKGRKEGKRETRKLPNGKRQSMDIFRARLRRLFLLVVNCDTARVRAVTLTAKHDSGK